MDFIRITKENLASEHICCAIAKETDIQVSSKKAWLAERLDDGLVFLKANARGKCFIEYIPAERAWAPVDAPGYLYIDCLWVSGQFKGQGFAAELLGECIKDARERGCAGICALSSDKKRPFLSDGDFLKHMGFIEADSAEPFYKLLYLPLAEGAIAPRFRESVRERAANADGFVIYYSPQCPYTAKYVPLLEAVAREKGAPFKAVRFESAAQAQGALAPFTAFSLFYNGELVTHETQSEPKFKKLLEEKGY